MAGMNAVGGKDGGGCPGLLKSRFAAEGAAVSMWHRNFLLLKALLRRLGLHKNGLTSNIAPKPSFSYACFLLSCYHRKSDFHHLAWGNG